MDVKSIMHKQVITTTLDSTLMEAARQMDDANVGALPICDNDKMVGMITDRDIIIRSTSAGQDPKFSRVRDAMTSPVIYCFEDQSFGEAAKIMEDNGVRRLPVLNRNKRLVGMLSVDDLASSGSAEGLNTEVIRRISEVTRPAA